MPQPNILVIMSDQLKATASHLYGHPYCETPALARLAQRGVRFEYAFTPHPLCVPARVSLWTGQYPHAHGARRNETLMPPGIWHAFKTWKEMGYHLGLIGKNHCFEAPEDLALFDTWNEITHPGIPEDAWHRGLPWWRPREAIDRAHSVRRNMPEVAPPFSFAATGFDLADYGTGLVAGQTVRFLEAYGDRPFVLWVSFPDPHEPYEVPRRYWEMFPPERILRPPWDPEALERLPERNRVLYRMLGFEDVGDDEVNGVLAAYFGMVRFLDDGVGQILNALEQLGLAENTIVVFCADHGDLSGEHDMITKGGVFYDALTRIPLIVSWPGEVPAGEVDDSFVSLIDIVPTLFQLQGLPIPPSIQGQPLPTVTDAPPRDAAFSEYGAGGPPFTMEHLRRLPIPYGRRALMLSLQWREAEGRRKMVRTREWKYVHDPMGDLDELYDLQRDPWELYNLAQDPAYEDVVAEMRLRLADWSILTEDGHPVPLPSPDKYAIAGGRPPTQA